MSSIKETIEDNVQKMKALITNKVCQDLAINLLVSETYRSLNEPLATLESEICIVDGDHKCSPFVVTNSKNYFPSDKFLLKPGSFPRSIKLCVGIDANELDVIGEFVKSIQEEGDFKNPLLQVVFKVRLHSDTLKSLFNPDYDAVFVSEFTHAYEPFEKEIIFTETKQYDPTLSISLD